MRSYKKEKNCENPEKLKGKPADCSPKQIRQCHGYVAGHPCVATAECEHPERLEGEPGDCSPEQIRDCHGENVGHPCAGRQKI